MADESWDFTEGFCVIKGKKSIPGVVFGVMKVRTAAVRAVSGGEHRYSSCNELGFYLCNTEIIAVLFKTQRISLQGLSQ